MKKGRKHFFFEKKKQKTFIPWRLAALCQHGVGAEQGDAEEKILYRQIDAAVARGVEGKPRPVIVIGAEALFHGFEAKLDVLGVASARGTPGNKSFLLLFFKKEALAFLACTSLVGSIAVGQTTNLR